MKVAFTEIFSDMVLCSLYRSDDAAFDRKETRGNVTFGCSSPGPCIPCSYLEKVSLAYLSKVIAYLRRFVMLFF